MKHRITLLASLALAAFVRAEDPEFEVWSYTGTDIYPSAIIATATVDWRGDEEEEKPAEDQMLWLGDRNGWVGARLFNIPAGAKVHVEVTGDGWLKTSKVDVVVEEAQDEMLVIPKGMFEFDALLNVKQQKPANVTVKATVNGKNLGEQHEVVTLRSVNECPFAVIFGEGDEATADDLSWMFAAYVNENHPWIDSILKEALDAGLVDSFDGYQSGDPAKVVAQVFAVWHVLQRHGVKYSDITNTPKSKFAAAQVVRFLDESVAGSQANCVDGSVIFASILTKISIKASLVLVPGHCMVAFELDPEGEFDPTLGADEQSMIGLETTMLGADKLKPQDELKKMPAKAKAKLAEAETAKSYATFSNAVDAAMTHFAEHGEEFDSEDDSAYKLIPIESARELGIMPIASGTKK